LNSNPSFKIWKGFLQAFLSDPSIQPIPSFDLPSFSSVSSDAGIWAYSSQPKSMVSAQTSPVGSSPTSWNQAVAPPLLAPSHRALLSFALLRSGEDEAKRRPATFLFPNEPMPHRFPFIFETADFKAHSPATIELL
jgi:hypothetical protein